MLRAAFAIQIVKVTRFDICTVEINAKPMSNKKQQGLQNKECFSRMNFLYQASMLMAGRNNTLAAYYGELCRNIGKKAVLRIDPDVKRRLCKRCSLALQPGLTAELEVATCGARRKRRRRNQPNLLNLDEHASIQLTCKQCRYKRAFKVKPDYKFWLEQPESVAEVITLAGTNKCDSLNEKKITEVASKVVKVQINKTKSAVEEISKITAASA